MNISTLWRRDAASLYKLAVRRPAAGQQPVPTPTQRSFVKNKRTDNLLVGQWLIESLIQQKPYVTLHSARHLPSGRVDVLRSYHQGLNLTAESYQAIVGPAMGSGDTATGSLNAPVGRRVVFEDRGTVRVVRPAAAGPTLQEFIDAGLVLTAPEAIDLAEGLIAAMRNMPLKIRVGLRPDQVVLSPGGGVKIVDAEDLLVQLFHRRRRLSTDSPTVLRPGDRFFVPPEILAGDKPTGGPAMSFVVGRLLIWAVSGGQPRIIKQRLSETWMQTLTRWVDSDPKVRPQTVEQIVSDLALLRLPHQPKDALAAVAARLPIDQVTWVNRPPIGLTSVVKVVATIAVAVMLPLLGFWIIKMPQDAAARSADDVPMETQRVEAIEVFELPP